MKTFLVLTASLLIAHGAAGQGTVFFIHNTPGQVKAPVYDVEPDNPTLSKKGNTSAGFPAGSQSYGGALLAGTGFTAQLWGRVGSGIAEADLELLATRTFRTGAAAGFIENPSSVTVPNTPCDGPLYYGTFQMRAWNNLGGTITTWEQVMAAPQFVPHGSSDVLSPPSPLGSQCYQINPLLLTGLRSFNLFIVPEPSVLTLGALGLGALLYFLRRQQ